MCVFLCSHNDSLLNVPFLFTTPTTRVIRVNPYFSICQSRRKHSKIVVRRKRERVRARSRESFLYVLPTLDSKSNEKTQYIASSPRSSKKINV